MYIDLELVGKRLKRQRQSLKMTQEQLAEIADISNVYVSKLENGLANPTLSTLSKITHCLNTSPSYLIDGYVCDNSELKSEISLLLEECSPYTLKIITDMVKAIKKSQTSD